MANKPSNESVLEQLRNGMAQFELVSYPVLSISTSNSRTYPTALVGDYSHRFFASIGQQLRREPERFSVVKVTGNGSCLFRALAKGMALNRGKDLSPNQEKKCADELRKAVKESLCKSGAEHLKHQRALVHIDSSYGSRDSYCRTINELAFSGGESELLVLSKLYKQPIIVYRVDEDREYINGGRGYRYRFVHPPQTYGTVSSKKIKLWSRNSKKKKEVVKLLYYSDRKHYDLLRCEGEIGFCLSSFVIFYVG